MSGPDARKAADLGFDCAEDIVAQGLLLLQMNVDIGEQLVEKAFIKKG
ncbi:hypothetical protein [Xanthomonas arboricola]